MSRVHVIAIVMASAVALSGGAPGEVSRDVSPQAVSAQRARAVTGRIRTLNPTLTEPRAERIWAAVDRYSARYALEPDLVLAVLEVESHARIGARSPKGALGLMQVMPYMAEMLDLAGNHTTVETNVEAGCVILAHNIRRLGEEDGISAYFWGSDIRGASYLNRVRGVREVYRQLLAH